MSTESKDIVKISDVPRKMDVFGNIQDFGNAQRIAKALADSSLVPAQYRNSVSNVLIALEVAGRLDASPLAVMQKMYIVGGKPAFEATFVIAAVNTSGRFSPLRFHFDGEGDQYGCRAIAKDSYGNECVGTKITRAMVSGEGWNVGATKDGKYYPSKWETMEEQMFKYRAAAFWQREFAPELTMGMQTVEEAGDIEIKAGPVEVVSRTDADPIATRTAKIEKEKKPEPQKPETEKSAQPDKPPQQELSENHKRVIAAATAVWGDGAMNQITRLCRTCQEPFTFSEANRLQLQFLDTEINNVADKG